MWRAREPRAVYLDPGYQHSTPRTPHRVYKAKLARATALSKRSAMPPPPAAMMHSQPSKGACLVPDNRRQLEQQDRAYKKAKLAAASSPRLSPARIPKAKAVEVPKVPSCLKIGTKRPRPREGPAAPQVATPAAVAAPATATAVSLVAYGDSDSEGDEPGDT